VAGLASLGARAFVEHSLAVNERGRRIAYGCCDELGLEYLPSHTNFLMHQIHGDLRTHITRMRDAGIRVGRPFPPMLGFNRVSIGLPEEMERFAETLRSFRAKGWI
jgi:histidinol-phosphate aminotransferase